MTREELIAHLEHLAEYVKYSEDAPALREVIEMLKCSGNPNGSDTIYRQAAIDALDCINGVEEVLRSLPSAHSDHIAEVSKKVDADLISRRNAIDIVRNRVKRYTTACVLAVTELQQLPSAQPDLSEYSDKLWCNAYERGKREAQPDIIHCKDCYWWTKQEDSLQGRCDRYGHYPTGAWFCSSAERRKDGQD